jgi:hypothetical protein
MKLLKTYLKMNDEREIFAYRNKEMIRGVGKYGGHFL